MRNDLSMRIVFAGGGSGGHVYPMLAVIEALQKRAGEIGATLELIRMGPRDGYDALFLNRGVRIDPVVSGKVRRYFSPANFIDVPKLLIGFVQALFKLFFIMPDAVFSKGGTGALPVVLAAWWYRIPVVVHESDAEPGRTNLASARFAKKIFVSFERAAGFFNPKKTEISGTPVREELFAERMTKPLAKEALGFSSSNPLVLVTGGSQGSVRINEFILANLAELAKMTQVLHQTGIPNLAEAQKLSRAALIDASFKNRYQAVGYFEKNLATALAAADLAVARSGSGTIAEMSAFGIPAILIPLGGSANDHQRVNAYEFAKTGAAIVVEESNLLPGIFLGQIRNLFANPETLAKMAAASARSFVPNAAEKIAQAILMLGA